MGDLCRGDDVCGDAALSNCRRRRLQDREDDIIVGSAIYRVVVAAPRPTAAPVAEPTLRPTTARPIRGDDDDDDDDARPDVPARTRAPTLRGTSSPTRDGGGSKHKSSAQSALTIGLAVVGAGTVLLLAILLVVCLCKRDEGPEIGLDGKRKGFLPPGAARSPRTPQTPSRRRAAPSRSGSDLAGAGAATRQVTRSGSDLGADGPSREGPRGERSVTCEDEFDALADALERARALDSGPAPRKSEIERHFEKKPSREGGRRAAKTSSREGGRRAADAKPSREGGRQQRPSRSGSDRAVLGPPAAAGAARGYWLDRGTNTDGRRGSATYWRDRAAATEKPSRGRDQGVRSPGFREGRKVSPHRDHSGKPAKGDRRRREAGIFTL